MKEIEASTVSRTQPLADLWRLHLDLCVPAGAWSVYDNMPREMAERALAGIRAGEDLEAEDAYTGRVQTYRNSNIARVRIMPMAEAL